MRRIVVYALVAMMLLTSGPAAFAMQPKAPQELTPGEQSAGSEPQSVSPAAESTLAPEQVQEASTQASDVPPALDGGVQQAAEPVPAVQPERPPQADTAVSAPNAGEIQQTAGAAGAPADAAPENAGQQNTESGFTYEQSGGSVTITGYTGSETNVVIPSQIAGMQVTRIGDDAFSEAASITNVQIPDGVVSIGDRAFYYCQSLNSITLPESLNSIGMHAFFYCHGLTNIDLPRSTRSIGQGAFQGCQSLQSIVIPEGVTEIPMLAFQNCTALEAVTLPRTLQSVGSRAFFRCGSLKRLTIPDVSIGANAFTLEQVGQTPIPQTHMRFLGTEAEWMGSGERSLFDDSLSVIVCDDHIVSGVENLDLGFEVGTPASTVYRGQNLTVGVNAAGPDAYLLDGTVLTATVHLNGFDPADAEITLQGGRGSVAGTVGDTTQVTGLVTVIDGSSISKDLPSIDVSSAEGALRVVHKGSDPGPVNPASVKVGQDYVITVAGVPAGTSGTLQLSGMEVMECAGGVQQPDGSVSFSSAEAFSCTVRITKNVPLKASIANSSSYGYAAVLAGDWEPELDKTEIEIIRRDAGPLYPGQEIDLVVQAYDRFLDGQSVPFSVDLINLELVSGEGSLAFKDGIAEIQCRVIGTGTVSAAVTAIDSSELSDASIAPWTQETEAALTAAVKAVPKNASAQPDGSNAEEVRLGEEYILSIEGAPDAAHGKLMLSGMTLVEPADADKTELDFSSPRAFSCTVRITGLAPSVMLEDVSAYGMPIEDCGNWNPSLVEPRLVVTAAEQGPFIAGQPITLIAKVIGVDAEALRGKSADLILQFEGVTPDTTAESFVLQNGMAEIPCTIDKDSANERVSATAKQIYDLPLTAGQSWIAEIGEPVVKMHVVKDDSTPEKGMPKQVTAGEEYIITLTGAPKGTQGTLSLQGMTIVEPEDKREESEISFSSLSDASYVVRISDSDSAAAVLKSAAAYGIPVNTEGIVWKPDIVRPDLAISSAQKGPFYPGQPVTLIVRAADAYANALGDTETPLELELTGLTAEADSVVLKNGEAQLPCKVLSNVYRVSASVTEVNGQTWTEGQVWNGDVNRPTAEMRVGMSGETQGKELPKYVMAGEEYTITLTGSPKVMHGTLSLQGMMIVEPEDKRDESEISFSSLSAASCVVKITDSDSASAVLKSADAYGVPFRTEGIQWRPEIIKPELAIAPMEQGPIYPGQTVTLMVEANDEYAEKLGDTEIILELDLTGLTAETNEAVLKDGKAEISCIVSADAHVVTADITEIDKQPFEHCLGWNEGTSTPTVALHVSTNSSTAEGTYPQQVQSGQEYVLSITGQPGAVTGKLDLEGMVLIDSDGQETSDEADFTCDGTHSFRVLVVGPAPLSAALKDVTAYEYEVDTSSCKWTPELVTEQQTVPTASPARPDSSAQSPAASSNASTSPTPSSTGAPTSQNAPSSGASTSPAPSSTGAPASQNVPSSSASTAPTPSSTGAPTSQNAPSSSTSTAPTPSPLGASASNATAPAGTGASPSSEQQAPAPTAQTLPFDAPAGQDSAQTPVQGSESVQPASDRPFLVPEQEGTLGWAIQEANEEWVLIIDQLGTSNRYVSGQNVIDSFAVSPDTVARVHHADGTVRAAEQPIATRHEVHFEMPDGTVHKYKVVVKGDVHSTGMYGLHQLVGIAAAYAGAQPLDDLGTIAADLDRNGQVDLTDLVDAGAQYIECRNFENAAVMG